MIRVTVWVLACLLANAITLRADDLLVANKSANELVRVDLRRGEVTARVATGEGPHEVAVSPDGRTAWVANYGSSGMFHDRPGHTLSEIDLASFTVRRVIDLAPHSLPHGLATSRGGKKLWVTTEGSQSVLELDTRSGEILRAFETGQETTHMIASSPDQRHLYATNVGSGSLSVIDRYTGGVQTLATGDDSEGVAVRPDGGEVWVTNRGGKSVAIVDVDQGAVVATLPAGGRMPIRVRFVRGGHEAWVVSVLSNRITVFDTSTREAVGRIDVGLAALGLPGPVGLLFSPDGSRAYVAHFAANSVAEIDVATRKILRTFETGDAPDGMAWEPGRAGESSRR